jgi:hypothetical protein
MPGSPSERKIFVSYRRVDNADFVERIRDWFMQRYGRSNVFMDFDNIPPFTLFADYIRDRVRECDVLIAIIGPRWLELLREKTLDPANDYVRVEIQLALEEKKLIAPICIKGASVPRNDDLPDDLRAMAGYNAAHLDSGRTFLDNIELIMDAVEQELVRRERVQVDLGNVEAMSTAPFELHDAILNFHRAADDGQWKEALRWLERIRQSRQAPRFFRLDEYESEIRSEIEREEAERDYKVIRIMVERAAINKEKPERIWDALQMLWEAFPGYDPDNLAERFRPQIVEQIAASARAIEDILLEPLPEFDAGIFDQLATLDTDAADAMFDPAVLAQIASEEVQQDENDKFHIDIEEAQRLGIIEA